jgi:hypothetical protein
MHRHARPEVGATDADIDDVGDAFAGKSAPLAAMNALAEIAHARQHGLDFIRCLSAGTQVHVAHGTVFGVVDRGARPAFSASSR